jgi:hypothetical protein
MRFLTVKCMSGMVKWYMDRICDWCMDETFDVNLCV